MEKDNVGSVARTARLGLYLSFALLLGYVESLIPFSFGLPGVKLGLANLAVLLVLYLEGAREAFAVDILRILLSGFMFGSLYGVMYSMAGGMVSFLAMLGLKKSGRFSMYGVSMAGGVSHNAGQLVVAAWVVRTGGIFYYLPALLIAGVLTGFLIGLVGTRVYPRVCRLKEGKG